MAVTVSCTLRIQKCLNILKVKKQSHLTLLFCAY